MFKKISSKIILRFSLVFAVVLSLVLLITGIYTSSLIKNNISTYIRASNRARAEHVRTYIQDQETMSVILAGSSVYRDFLKEPITSSSYPGIKDKIYKRFARTIDADKQIYEVFIINANGMIVASSNPSQEGSDKSSNEYFTMGKDGVHLKDIYFSETTQKIIYVISSPIKDDNGTLLGVSVLRYLPANFFDIVKSENGLGKTEENFLINKDKLFITPSIFWGDSVILKQKVDTQNSDDCFNPAEIEYVKKNGYSNIAQVFGEQINENNDYRNINVIAAHSYIPETGWCLITKTDKAELFSFQVTLMYIFLLVFLLAILIYFLVGISISKKITNPILALILGIKNIKEGNLDYDIKNNSSDEVGALSDEFNNMALAIKESRNEIEKKVKEQTEKLRQAKNELEQKFSESDDFNKLMVGREIKMVELKDRITKLESDLATKKIREPK